MPATARARKALPTTDRPANDKEPYDLDQGFPEKLSNYTPIPHDYFDSLYSKTRGKTQFWVVGYVLRMTLGRERKRGTPAPLWVELTISAIAAKLNCSRREIELCLEDATQRKLIARESIGRSYRYCAVPMRCSLTVHNEAGVAERVMFPGWEHAPGYETPVIELKKVPPPAPPPSAIVVKPGQHSQAMHLEQAVQEVVYRNGGKSVAAMLAPRIEGETLVVEIGGYANYSSHMDPDDMRTTVRITHDSSADSEELSRIDYVCSYLTPKFLRLYKSVPDEALLQQIDQRLGNATAVDYGKLCDAKLEKKPKPKTGLWLFWADDARAAADVIEQDRQEAAERVRKEEAAAAERHEAWVIDQQYEEFRTSWAREEIERLQESDRTALKAEAHKRIAWVKDRIPREQFESQVNEGMLLLLTQRAPSRDEWQATVK